MKLAAALTRSIQADFLREIGRAIATGTRDAGRGLRTELRRQVSSAGLGQRIANRSGATGTTRTNSSTPRAWSTPRRRRSSAHSTRAR
jgi:hypothetical protein